MLPPKVRELVEALRRLDVYIDLSSRNFGLDERDNVVYMDDLYMGMDIYRGLGQAIDAMGGEKQKRHVMQFLDRLRYWSYRSD